MFLRRCHDLMVEDDTVSHKIDYVTICLENLNHKGHLNRTTDSKVTAILLNGLVELHREGSARSLQSRFVSDCIFLLFS